jgi:hypothetical protein
MRAEDPREDGATPSAAVSSLLIGASGGRAISIADSLAAVARGVVEANRELRRHPRAGACVDEVEFVELYEDAAIEAAKAASALGELLKNALEPGETIEFDGRLRALSSGLTRRSVNQYDTGWWRRILIEGEEADDSQAAQSAQAPGAVVPGFSQKLSFDNLTDRARAENTYTESQTPLVNSLLESATSQTSYDSATATALFELLVPNSLKDQSAEEADLLLVVDPAASRYPWELMAERSRDKVSPLAVRMGMIRQLKTERFRVGPRAARDHSALVLGDPTGGNGLAELKGAQEEARTVADLLSRRGYTTTTLVGSSQPGPRAGADAGDIARALFAQDYRILHLAGHGTYNPREPARSGMILRWSEDAANCVFLRSREVEQIRKIPDLVFLNCCHLGRIDQPLPFPAHQFAASIAQQLIEMGVKAVIAAGWAVDDAAAVEFARSFYRGMLAGGKFGEAVKRARADAFALGGNNTWGAYQCYGNPDFALEPKQTDPGTRRFYARRECIEELRNISAESKGANETAIAGLKDRLAAVEAALGSYWRDGESLFDLAEGLKSTGDFERAIAVYQEAIRQEKASAPVKAIEQLANVMDRFAAGKFQEDPVRARKDWDEAERRLASLNDLLGKSKERLSLLGAIYKRRAGKDAPNRAEFQKKALEYYIEAYEYSRDELGDPDPYPGLNAIALAWLAGQTVAFEKECVAEAESRRDAEDFWERVYRPDALMLQLVMSGRGSEEEVVAAYKLAMQHAAPNESKSATGQIEYLKAQTADATAAAQLERIFAAIVPTASVQRASTIGR